MSALVYPGLEVIAHEHRIEAELLGEAGEAEQLTRSELLRGGLVADLDHGAAQGAIS